MHACNLVSIDMNAHLQEARDIDAHKQDGEKETCTSLYNTLGLNKWLTDLVSCCWLCWLVHTSRNKRRVGQKMMRIKRIKISLIWVIYSNEKSVLLCPWNRRYCVQKRMMAMSRVAFTVSPKTFAMIHCANGSVAHGCCLLRWHAHSHCTQDGSKPPVEISQLFLDGKFHNDLRQKLNAHMHSWFHAIGCTQLNGQWILNLQIFVLT